MADHFPSARHQASFDEALAEFLARPSYAAQILHAAASLLDDAPNEPLADYVLAQAMEWAGRSVTHRSPGATGDDLDRALAALPHVGLTTHGEYAASLRDIAARLDDEQQLARKDYKANAARRAAQNHRDDANLAAHTPRCPAAHPEDPTPCDGPTVVTVLDATNEGADGCEHHAARLLASLHGGRVYPLPGAPAGAAIRVFKAADSIRPFAWIDAPRTRPEQLSHEENRRRGESQ